MRSIHGQEENVLHHLSMPYRCYPLYVRMDRDIKRRDTRNYLLATAGNKRIVLWCVNPYTGEVSHERVVCEARGSLVRDIMALAFSEDREKLICATSTGDFVGVDLRTKQVQQDDETLPSSS